MVRLRTVLVAGLVFALLTLAPTAPATALSCVGPRTVLEDAQQVYAGRIVDARGGRLLVEVDEVWWGGPVERRVWLRVELEGWSEWAGAHGEVPDGYRSPDTWVFAPRKAAVNPCTAFRDGTPGVGRMHPGETAEPVADGALEGRGEAPPPAAGSIAVAGLLGVLGAGLFLVVARYWGFWSTSAS